MRTPSLNLITNHWIYYKNACLKKHLPYRISLTLCLEIAHITTKEQSFPPIVKHAMQETRLVSIRALYNWMGLENIFRANLQALNLVEQRYLQNQRPHKHGDLECIFEAKREHHAIADYGRVEVPTFDKLALLLSNEQKANQILASLLVITDFANKAIAHVTSDRLANTTPNTRIKINRYKGQERIASRYGDELADHATHDAIYGICLLAKHFVYIPNGLVFEEVLANYCHLKPSAITEIFEALQSHHESLDYSEFLTPELATP